MIPGRNELTAPSAPGPTDVLSTEAGTTGVPGVELDPALITATVLDVAA